MPKEMKVTDYHLCSIFTNLLDNAIEACEALPEPERSLTILTNARGEYLCIRVENSCTEAHAGRPRRKGHGLGLPITSEIVQNYGGDLRTEYKDGQFVAEAVFRWK